MKLRPQRRRMKRAGLLAKNSSTICVVIVLSERETILQVQEMFLPFFSVATLTTHRVSEEAIRVVTGGSVFVYM